MRPHLNGSPLRQRVLDAMKRCSTLEETWRVSIQVRGTHNLFLQIRNAIVHPYRRGPL